MCLLFFNSLARIFYRIARFFARRSAIDRCPVFDNNEAVYSDSHLHLVDLSDRDPDFLTSFPVPDWRGAVVAHDIEEFERSETLRASLPFTVAGFGIHPQAIRWDTADYMRELAEKGKIAFIGEAGFEFFGDRPEWIRNDENIKRQREAFEFQLTLAVAKGLSLLIHSRKGLDLIMGYGRELAKLPALIFHGWPGRAQDSQAFLKKGLPAYFSFGMPLLRDAKHAMETCAAIPEDRILSETDAPWQPPKGETWTGSGKIAAVSRKIAAIRGIDTEAMNLLLRKNFNKAFGLKE